MPLPNTLLMEQPQINQLIASTQLPALMLFLKKPKVQQRLINRKLDRFHKPISKWSK